MQVHIPSQRQKLRKKIRHTKALPGPLQSKTLAALETMPDGDRVCHGDFHPDNILLPSQGEIIIDWIDASRGNPLADLPALLFLPWARRRPAKCRIHC
jgi:aminoglycoside phosphotransferase (APT) family kinase protein